MTIKKKPTLGTTEAFDGVPVFHGLALMLKDARENGWTGILTSADRRKGVAEKYGKRSQWWLYMAYWVWHLKGANPANAPGRSTHELRSDAVAYRGPVGRPLAWWQLGFDATNAPQLRAVLARLGYEVFRPYPTANEEHHSNLRRSPKSNLKKRGLLPMIHLGPQRTSQAGREFLAREEGYVPYAYNDMATKTDQNPLRGNATFGIGHLIHIGPVNLADQVKWGTKNQPQSYARVMQVFKHDLRGYEKVVRDSIGRRIPQPAFDACVSLCFNIGRKAFAESSVAQNLREHHWTAAANAFLMWDRPAVLLPRRQRERELFLTGRYH